MSRLSSGPNTTELRKMVGASAESRGATFSPSPFERRYMLGPLVSAPIALMCSKRCTPLASQAATILRGSSTWRLRELGPYGAPRRECKHPDEVDHRVGFWPTNAASAADRAVGFDHIDGAGESDAPRSARRRVAIARSCRDRQALDQMAADEARTAEQRYVLMSHIGLFASRPDRMQLQFRERGPRASGARAPVVAKRGRERALGRVRARCDQACLQRLRPALEQRGIIGGVRHHVLHVVAGLGERDRFGENRALHRRAQVPRHCAAVPEPAL